MTRYLVVQRGKEAAIAVGTLRDYFLVDVFDGVRWWPDPRRRTTSRRREASDRSEVVGADGYAQLTLSPGPPSERVLPRYLREAR